MVSYVKHMALFGSNRWFKQGQVMSNVAKVPVSNSATISDSHLEFVDVSQLQPQVSLWFPNPPMMSACGKRVLPHWTFTISINIPHLDMCYIYIYVSHIHFGILDRPSSFQKKRSFMISIRWLLKKVHPAPCRLSQLGQIMPCAVETI